MFHGPENHQRLDGCYPEPGAAHTDIAAGSAARAFRGEL